MIIPPYLMKIKIKIYKKTKLLMTLRKALKDVPQIEAMELLINRLKKTSNNLEFLMTLQGG